MVIIAFGIWERKPKKQRIGYSSVGLLIILLAVQAGCGSPPKPGTPPGTYNIMVSGAASSLPLQHSSQVTLTVR
jgi:hypothetical protein